MGKNNFTDVIAINRFRPPYGVRNRMAVTFDLLPRLKIWTDLQLVSGSESMKKSSYKEHRVDALAPYAEEGRGKLR